ncbi:primary-amine oxidase [Mytilus galloprovincialis]|uniref:Amine oxidase n=1 Tax=Mytilus galloprovincialis TaxID=29158 RepID=A0A8B6HHJ0_MYTGA|nr:primary-amine oxidase [Mytilus galloprovincialis]
MANNYSNRAYEFTNEPKEKKTSSLKILVCGQLLGIIVFIIGFAAGLCIGIFVYNGNESKLAHTENCQNQRGTERLEIKQSEQPVITTVTNDIPSSINRGNETLNDKGEVKNKDSEHTPTSEDSDEQTCKRCVWRNPILPSSQPNLFAPLSAEEMTLVHRTLVDFKIVDVDHGQELTFKSNFIGTMFLHPPNKREALQYLDDDGKFPGRYATAVVIRGNIDQKDYMQYKIGPLEGKLPDVKVTQLLKNGEVPYESRPYDNVEIGEIIFSILADLDKISALLKDSFDINNVYEDVSIMPNGPYNDGSGRVSRFTIGLRGLGDKEFDFLNILPFTGRLSHIGQNTSDWFTYDFFYLNQGPFSNITELINVYNSGKLKYIKYPEGYKEYIIQETLPIRQVNSPVRPDSHYPGTSTYEPHGPRYTISGHVVNWMGWSFTVSTGQHRGPSIFDVRFKGERIIYENSLNEIALVYSADGSGQDNMVYLDSVYGLGEAKRAIPRVDCPFYASYLNSSGWNPRGLKASILPTFCIFEVNAQDPLWRHKGQDVEAGLNNNFLVARYPTQVGNYDYIIDFQFYLDGRVKTTASATGFIQGSFWNPSSDVQTPFGYKVANSLIGPIHDHTFGFKVDMDVAGKDNDFQLIHWKYGDVNRAMKNNKTDPSNYFFYNHTRFIEWDYVEKETGLKVDTENQKYWTIINRNKKNKNGVNRGYRIIPMTTSSQNLPDDYPRMQELSFTKYHCAITKQKDNEQYLKPLYFPVDNKLFNDTSPSQLYLEDMLDGESIANEDIVTWLSVGFLHIPTSEDVPMTIKVESGFTLKPFNFFDRTATFDIPALAVFNNTVYDNAPVPDMCVSEPYPIQH